MKPLRANKGRRDFLKTCAAASAGSVISSSPLLRAIENPVSKSAASATGALGSVRPLIGTGWHGHMYPGAQAPFGLVQLSPDTAGPANRMHSGQRDNYVWDHCSGYHYTDNVIVGFTHTHVQGTGGIDLGDILLMPIVEGRNWSWEDGIPSDQAQAQIEALGFNSPWVAPHSGYSSFFSHETEVARAGYYGVHLHTPDVKAELTATARCGMHRYSFPALPAGIKRGVILDLVHGLGGKVYQAELNIESASRVSGVRANHGWAADRQIYFVIEFLRPAGTIQVQIDGKESTAQPGDKFSGEKIKAIFTEAQSSEPLIVRVGISCTGVEGAAKNLAAEIPHWDFDGAVHGASESWRKTLAVLEADLAGEPQRQTFYTGAYHSLTAPATFNDGDGTYRGQDRKNHADPGFTKYTILSIWDIYRGEFPFLMLTQPHRATDIVRTLILDYQQLDQHSLPMWTLWGNETWSMDGFHAAGMIAGAYVRGLRDFDAEAAYAAIRDTALVGATAKGNRGLQEMFRKHGFVPMDLHDASVSCTLDLAYDYWCAGVMAELLGKHDDAQMF